METNSRLLSVHIILLFSNLNKKVIRQTINLVIQSKKCKNISENYDVIESSF